MESHLGTDRGDGTVSRMSATPIEAKEESTAMFAGTRHGSLQNAAAVLTSCAAGSRESIWAISGQARRYGCRSAWMTRTPPARRSR